MLQPIRLFFVGIKPLTLFVLIFGPPFISVLAIVASASKISTAIVAMAAITAYMGILLIGWMYSVGYQGSIALGMQSGKAFRIFRVSIFYLFFTLVLMVLAFYLAQLDPPRNLNAIFFAVVLVALACLYYLIGYLTNIVVKMDGAPSISLYATTFVSLLIPPAGIFFVQRRVNSWSEG